jgi:hypothetical protein
MSWWLLAFNFYLNFNIVFMDAGIILVKPHLVAASFYLFTLIVCCQTQWQRIIYLFSLGEYLLRGESYHLLYLLCASIFMSTHIYINFLATSI